MPQQAIELNWKNISEFNIENAQKLAGFLQLLREAVNNKFKDKNGGNEIGLIVTSGFRCIEWEKIRKRSGASRHTQSDAADIVPNCSYELAVEIIQWMYEVFNPLTTGHIGGFAIKKPTYENGNIKAIGFAHFDFGKKRRWEY